jgi:hypothetical protein
MRSHVISHVSSIANFATSISIRGRMAGKSPLYRYHPLSAGKNGVLTGKRGLNGFSDDHVSRTTISEFLTNSRHPRSSTSQNFQSIYSRSLHFSFRYPLGTSSRCADSAIPVPTLSRSRTATATSPSGDGETHPRARQSRNGDH